MPVLVDQDGVSLSTQGADSGSAPSEKKSAYLVHLEVSKMAVTVYTNEEFAEENVQQTGNDDDRDSLNSDELDADADEFSGAHQQMGTQLNIAQSSSGVMQRAPTQKLPQIGSATNK